MLCAVNSRCWTWILQLFSSTFSTKFQELRIYWETTIDQLLKKFSAFYKTEISEKYSQWHSSYFLSCTTGINSTTFHLFFKNNFNFIFSLRLILQNCLLPSSSATKPFTYFSCLQSFHIFHPSYTPWFESFSCCSSPKALLSLSLSEILTFWLRSQTVLTT